ncbi:TrmB family transcriptional regulator [Candidatus Parcubacteria bacterium]|nr:TrmB family transcriptional regulator [Candidatus Parcubacteria bacterium]
MIEKALQKFGLKEKEINVYLALLNLGPSPVRKIAQRANINRGTNYDILRKLVKMGLVSYYEKRSHKYFTPEDPAKIIDILQERENKIAKTKSELKKIIPDLQSFYSKISQRPFVRYYEGYSETKEILKDVLITMSKSKNKEYFVYSAESIREYLYKTFRNFSEERIKKDIKVKVIAIGKGGKLRGKDERKWLNNVNESAPNYIIVYENKTAFISIGQNDEPIGIIVEDGATSKMQKIIFNHIWNNI